MNKESILNWYFSNGFKIILLKNNSKEPLESGYKFKFYTKDQILNHNGNLGMLIPNNMLIIDVDVKRQDGKLSFNKFTKDLNLNLKPNVLTSSSGFHVYTKIDSNKKRYMKQNYSRYPGIDFLCFGRYVVIPPSIINDGFYQFVHENIFNLNNRNLDNEIVNLDTLEKNKQKDKQKIQKQNLLQQQKEKNTLIKKTKKENIRFLKNCLKEISSNCSYTDWLYVLIIIFNVYEGDEAGLLLAKSWSAKDFANYNESEIETKWSSFSVDYSNKLNLGSLYTIMEKQGIKINKNITLLENFKNFVNEKIEIAKKELENWVFIQDEKKYFNIVTYKSSDYRGFYIANKIKSHMDGKLSNIPSCFSRLYNPLSNEKLITIGEHTYVNSYKKPTFDESSLSDEWLNLVLNHINTLSDGNKTLLYWLIAQVKHPGKLIKWMPFVWSKVEGIGKSFIGELIRASLGRENVIVLHTNNLIDNFTGWANKGCCAILEDIKVNNKHEASLIVDKLKPYITNETISVRELHKEPFQAINYTNYIAFSNYLDVIKISENSRRFFPILCKFESIQDFEHIVGMPQEQYFNKLFDGLDKYIYSFVKYCLETDLPDDFYVNYNRAPYTNDIKLLIETCDYDNPYINYIKELIYSTDENTRNINEDFIVNEHLKDLLSDNSELLPLNNKLIDRAKRDLGYFVCKDSKTSNIVKIDGKNFRFWVKIKHGQDVDIDSIKNRIKQNLQKSDDDYFV